MYFPLLGTMPNLSLVSAVAAEAPAQRQAQNCGAPTTSRETLPRPLATLLGELGPHALLEL